jgi:hypothetical protein
VYFTAWPTADGRVHFSPDIYRRDGRVERVTAGELNPDARRGRVSRARAIAAAVGTR